MWYRFCAPCSLLFLLWLTVFPAVAQNQPASSAGPTILSCHLEGAISPIQADFLEAALAAARARDASGLLIRLDTPGGSVEVMRRMVKALRQSLVPTILWIGPAGAQAASAGVFLVAAAQVNAMAPQTTIGSASPVGLGGGDLHKTLDAKVRNDLTSLIRSLAEGTGRNTVWYQRSVTEAANLTASEAVQAHVVDFLAISPDDLLDQLGKRGLSTPQGRIHFQGNTVRLEAFEPGLRHKLLAWLLDPQVAYILLLIGVAGVFFELTTPGAILPGVIGGLCLIPAFYALAILPVNVAGLLLLLLGGGFFLLEIHITSYGLLSVAGLAALFLGSLLLFNGSPTTRLPLSLILPTVLGVAAILAAAGWILAKAQRQKPRTGLEALPGQLAVVRHWKNHRGKVLVRGELWDAVPSPETEPDFAPHPDTTVRIVAVDGLRLRVTQAQPR